MPNRRQWYLLGQFAVMGLAGYFLPRYGTTLIVDLVWGAFEASLLTFVYQRVRASSMYWRVLADNVRAYLASFLYRRSCATGIRRILISTCLS